MIRSVHRPVVGIDASTKTGLCTDGVSELVKHGSVSKGDRVGEVDRLQRIWEWAGALPATAIVFIEGYNYNSKFHAITAGEIGATIRLRLHIRGVPFVEVSPKALKKYATGKGNAGKPDMRMAAFKRLGVDDADDNRVDALWLYAIGMDWLGKPIVELPQVNREALDALQPVGHIDRLVTKPIDITH